MRFFSTLAQDDACTYGNSLRIHCGSRYKDGTGILSGECKDMVFYQYSEVKGRATFKSYCPNCMMNENGHDVRLIPT